MPKIIVDQRESEFVVDELRRLGVELEIKPISPGDYVVSEGIAVERKSVDDFFRSVFDRRLFDQMRRLSEAYDWCCLLVEGDAAYRLTRMRNPLVFWGALAKVLAEWRAPVVFTLNEKESADFIFSLARKLQEKGEKVIARYKPKTYSLARRQRFVVEGLPDIGPKLADLLLGRFGSVRRVFTASLNELRSVRGIGERRAKRIIKFLEAPYLQHGIWLNPGRRCGGR